jgi:drug/metabolite transporter (DMT)-like permease
MCVGVTVFLLGGSSHRKESNATTLFGVGLVSLALFFDGVYAGMQQRLVNSSSEFELMFHMNGWLGVLALLACLSSSELSTARAYAATHDGLYAELAAYTASKAAGTLCIYRLLRESGTLVVATVTTLRKVLSVLLSVLTFGHALSPPQIAVSSTTNKKQKYHASVM